MLVAVVLLFGCYQQARWEKRRHTAALERRAQLDQQVLDQLKSFEAQLKASPHIDFESRLSTQQQELAEVVFTQLKEQNEANAQHRREIERRLSSQSLTPPTFGR